MDVAEPERVGRVIWADPRLRGGTGIVECTGDVVYLGAMRNGLITFDVADKSRIVELSRFVPDTTYPDRRPDPAKVNLRGLTVRNDRL